MIKTYHIKPVPKPRMTRSDKWKQRPCVMEYRSFKDMVRLSKFKLPNSYHMVFMFAMPKSWSKKKQAENMHKPHMVKPDKDNLEKAVLDAMFENDSHVWDGRVTKIWGEIDCIIVKEIEGFDFKEFNKNQ